MNRQLRATERRVLALQDVAEPRIYERISEAVIKYGEFRKLPMPIQQKIIELEQILSRPSRFYMDEDDVIITPPHKKQ